MAQPASPSMSLQDAPPHDHRISNHMKSDPEVPIDPSIAQQQQQSPTYPPPYSPYNPQAHDMAQYQGHPPPGMYQPRPDGWGGQYGHPAHMQGPYQSPATSVPNASPNVTAGGRPGQVCLSRQPSQRVPSVWSPVSHVASLTSSNRSIPLFQFPVPSSTSALVVDTKKSRECTSVAGKVVRRHMALSIT
jgi:hypothetical protein